MSSCKILLGPVVFEKVKLSSVTVQRGGLSGELRKPSVAWGQDLPPLVGSFPRAGEGLRAQGSGLHPSGQRESADAPGLEFPGENANMQQRIFSVSGAATVSSLYIGRGEYSFLSTKKLDIYHHGLE